MSSASSESEQSESIDSKKKQKVKRVNIQKKSVSSKLCHMQGSSLSLSEKLISPFTIEDSDEQMTDSECSDDLLKGNEDDCMLDFNLISDALEKTQIDNNKPYDLETREIERKNNILMRKILSHSKRPSQYKLSPQNYKISNSLVNRKKQQQKIEKDNLILLKKIKNVKPFGLSVPKK